ncbi:MAG: hypothetical protein DHS20C16_24100 [Phycisphaerae bacterium]|nr:MAG: hypothetical protein DHS20C16_24100 [Phycisphaerae bacterium]
MPTYPNESYPADATTLALNGQVDVATGLPYLARGINANSQPSYEVQYNRRQQRQNGILGALRQGMVVDEGSLNIGVYPIAYTLSSTRKSFDGATGVAVADDTTHKVYIDSSNALQVAASYPGGVTSYLPLATVVAASGTLTIQDDRALMLFAV